MTFGAMTKPRLRSLAAVLLPLALAGCSKDDAVRADLAAIDRFTEKLVERVQAAQDPAAGVEAGSQLLVSERTDLVERMTRVRAVRGFQLSDETKQLVVRSFTANLTKVNGLKLEMLRATMRNPELSAALDALVADYNALIEGE
jgi:hypothetical protein